MEDSTQLAPLPAAMDPISRPSSTSTQESLAHLPGITSLASAGSGMSSPQLRAETAPSASPAPATSPIPVPAPAPETATATPTEPIASSAIAMAAVSSMVPPPAPPLIQAHTPQNMIPPPPTFAASSPATGSAGNLPTCQNCSTSTTPLWRRDESGAVLCNACGLFLKLHGRPRPISLKTDVIKSRNRVKTIRPDLAMKKKQNMQAAAESNGALDPQTQASIAGAALSARRASQKSTNGHIEGSNSPNSHTATANMYNPHMSTFPGLEDGQYPPNALPGFGISGTSPGRAASPLNGERLDMPQTQEQLLAANSSLKTRVAELEVINDFIQRRLAQFEQYGSGQESHDGTGQTEAQLRSQLENVTQTEAQVRSQLEAVTQTESQLRAQLEDSHRRENMLKRRLDEMELELKEAKDALSAFESDRAAKRARTEDIKPEAEELTPPETGA